MTALPPTTTEADPQGLAAADRAAADLALVRAVLARELETINEYESFARRAHDPTLRAFFRHLAKEEKEHVAEAMHLIHQLDADQESMWHHADVRPEHFRGETPKPASQGAAQHRPASHPAAAQRDGAPSPAGGPDASPAAPRAASSTPAPRFTVGSLRGA